MIEADINLGAEPGRVDVPVSRPEKLKGNGAKLLRIAELAAQASEGRLRIATHEEDDSTTTTPNSGIFLKLDGKRLGRDFEIYALMGKVGEALSEANGWRDVLVMFLNEVLIPVRKKLPGSYAVAGKRLQTLGASVYKGELLQDWNALFRKSIAENFKETGDHPI